MKDYKELDEAIIDAIRFRGGLPHYCGVVWRATGMYQEGAPTSGQRARILGLVGRRLRALRKAGRIEYEDRRWWLR